MPASSRFSGPTSEPLTPREHEVLRWIAEGKGNRDIADVLGISLRTVEKHIENVLRKMGVENRTAAVMAWGRGETDK
tara:strand:- start:531 stop:761 length:231 start_codon:yes stop_codon:yes gene_type:complete